MKEFGTLLCQFLTTAMLQASDKSILRFAKPVAAHRFPPVRPSLNVPPPFLTSSMTGQARLQ
jgi:hypothetical protein